MVVSVGNDVTYEAVCIFDNKVEFVRIVRAAIVCLLNETVNSISLYIIFCIE